MESSTDDDPVLASISNRPWCRRGLVGEYLSDSSDPPLDVTELGSDEADDELSSSFSGLIAVKENPCSSSISFALRFNPLLYSV
jgi:hypothetical protein